VYSLPIQLNCVDGKEQLFFSIGVVSHANSARIEEPLLVLRGIAGSGGMTLRTFLTSMGGSRNVGELRFR
jgi:hypothetical protein